MDDDVLRRGRPTCHVEYDEATALLVGDSLQSLAFEILARTDFGDSHAAARDAGLLARASGSCGMAGGQAIDLAAVGKDTRSARTRTDARAQDRGADSRRGVARRPLRDGARRRRTGIALDRFAKRAGLLFQVVDDILDCTASTVTLGKTAGKDAAAEKPTYVSLIGLERAREFAADLRPTGTRRR
jgi:farnesyl diphosphate synthase